MVQMENIVDYHFDVFQSYRNHTSQQEKERIYRLHNNLIHSFYRWCKYYQLGLHNKIPQILGYIGTYYFDIQYFLGKWRPLLKWLPSR